MKDFKEIKDLLKNGTIDGIEALVLANESLTKVGKELNNKVLNSDIEAIKEEVKKAKTFIEKVNESKNNISRSMIEIDMLCEFLNPKEYESNKKGLIYLIDTIH